MYYFAYGSNLSHKQMAERCPGSKFLTRVVLSGYKLVFDGYVGWRGGPVANVVRADGQQVVGGLFEVTEEHIRALDAVECQNNYYQRSVMQVKDPDGSAYDAVVYWREPLEVGEPSQEYLAVIAEGKKDCGIDH
jgi:gamma-glutamylcyclotransferase (GGCT)/AIG2-like uncharacterized protein YtfP